MSEPEDQKVEVSELESLKQQIKQRDENLKAKEAESKALEGALQEERRARQETGAKLSEEVTNRFSAQESAIENSILASTAEIDALEKQQTQFMEEGKFSDASKISRLIASAQYRLDGAQNQKEQLKSHKQNADRQAEVTKNDPFAAYSDSARSWIRKNPLFLSDRKINAKVMAAHHAATADDIEVDSPEYFARLDDAIKPKIIVEAKDDDIDDEPPAPVRQPTKVSSGAPVSRSGNQQSSGSGGGKRIQLTAEQAEAAVISFPNMAPKDAYVKYAENIRKLKEAGKI